jgi:hypothetical protein
MNSSNKFIVKGGSIASTDEDIAKDIVQIGEILTEHGQEGLDGVTDKFGGVDNLEKLFHYAQKRQVPILYDFNERNGIKFPGYCSLNDETLNSNILEFSGRTWGKAKMYFVTTPEDFKRWSETVGFSYHPTASIDISVKFDRKEEIETSSSEVGAYYSARLTKDVSPTGFQGHYSSNSAYRELINSARNIDNDLKQLHAGKAFEIEDHFPYFGITNLKTEERYNSDGPQSSATPIVQPDNEGQRLWNEIFKNNLKTENRDESVVEAVYKYGLHAHEMGDYELAAAAFTMGADLRNPPSLIMLKSMQEKGIHPAKKPAR